MSSQDPRREAICAVVVTFHPDAGLPERLQRIAHCCSRVIVVDNGSVPSMLAGIAEAGGQTPLELLRNTDNLGIAAALNKGIRRGEEYGFEWVLTFDQDSAVLPAFLEILAKTLKSCPFREKVGAIGSQYTHPIIADPSGKKSLEDVAGYVTRRTVITSGCLISMEAFNTVGPFKEEFFIDCVDEEYCLRLRRRGFAVIATIEVGLLHRLGDLSEHRLLGYHFQVTNHSSIRRYYMTRNTFRLIAANVFTEPLWVARKLQRQVTEWLGICLAEPFKKAKLTAILLGLWHALSGRSGKLPSATHVGSQSGQGG